jgi:hypothetical protein
MQSSARELGYARQEPELVRSAFRIGRVGLLLSVFNLTAFGCLEAAHNSGRVHGQVYNSILFGLCAASGLSLALGFAGCFQHGARFISAMVMVISVLLLLLVSMFFVV